MYKKSVREIPKEKIPQLNYDSRSQSIVLSGEWSWTTLSEKMLTSLPELNVSEFNIDGQAISYMDTTGVYFIHKIQEKFRAVGKKCVEIKLLDADRALWDMTSTLEINSAIINRDGDYKAGFVERIGKRTLHLWYVGLELLTFFGYICHSLIMLFKKGHSLYFAGIIETVSSAGIKGIAISSMLCFLIGVNLTYQMAPQFVTYGANVYVVNFLGIALLREVTPLLTAIIVAGRTGSAITASIGTMKVQEEIDALRTMGISPIRRLVIPRLIGLLISLPILTMIADAASMGGGMIVASSSLDISYSLFLHRLQSYVSINNYVIGISKTFAFAWIIAMVGCFCGFRVKSNAESIGTQTTRSVVMSICLIIFVDAVFAIVFKILKM